MSKIVMKFIGNRQEPEVIGGKKRKRKKKLRGSVAKVRKPKYLHIAIDPAAQEPDRNVVESKICLPCNECGLATDLFILSSAVPEFSNASVLCKSCREKQEISARVFLMIAPKVKTIQQMDFVQSR